MWVKFNCLCEIRDGPVEIAFPAARAAAPVVGPPQVCVELNRPLEISKSTANIFFVQVSLATVAVEFCAARTQANSFIKVNQRSRDVALVLSAVTSRVIGFGVLWIFQDQLIVIANRSVQISRRPTQSGAVVVKDE